eukprot:s2879_g11.t1
MAASAMPAAEAAQSLASQLPCGLDEAADSQRRAFFVSFDPNGNAILSLAEVDDGLKKLLPSPLPREVVARAFHAAKAISAPVATFSNDYIDEKEFHYFVQYLHHYLQLWSWFCEVDTSCDQRVSIEEFRAALPQLNERLPGDIRDAAAAFNEVDADGGGMVLFDEFAHWVLCRGLALQGPGDDCPERQQAAELLRQRPNLASADGERRAASRGRSGRRQRHGREGNAGRPESATRADHIIGHACAIVAALSVGNLTCWESVQEPDVEGKTSVLENELVRAQREVPFFHIHLTVVVASDVTDHSDEVD